MYTYQMIGVADQNGKTYECKYGTYNKTDRFQFNSEASKIFDKQGYRELFDILVHENLWKLKDVKKMTVEDIEKELGYDIEIINKDDTDDVPSLLEILAALFDNN